VLTPTGTIRQLVILGAGGDLTSRLLLPALARLVSAGRLPRGLQVLGVDREQLTTEAFRSRSARALDAFASDLPASARSTLLDALSYAPADVTDARALGRAVAMDGEPLAAYLALPPAVFLPTVTALRELGLPEGSRVVVEKPFGEDLADARALNAELLRAFPETAVHRVDHFLAKQTIQNILGLRFANRVFEPLWSRQHIRAVTIQWDETLTVEGRAGYYDRAGALRDMIQNHLLQLLALVAMDPPATLDEQDLRNRKVDVLRAVRPPDPEEVAHRTLRARYTAGRIGDRDVPDYIDEPGVDGARETETYAAVTLTIENWRWAGVPFALATGKALAADRHEIAIHFQPVPHLAFAQSEQPRPNVLRLALDPDRMTLETTINGPGDPFDLEPATFAIDLAPQDLPAYARVLLSVLDGEPTLSIRGDEAEESWRLTEPILDAWHSGRCPLIHYPAGSEVVEADGPLPRPNVDRTPDPTLR